MYVCMYVCIICIYIYIYIYDRCPKVGCPVWSPGVYLVTSRSLERHHFKARGSNLRILAYPNLR